MGIVLNYCQYRVLYLGSYYNTGPYISFPHFGNSNLGKLPGGYPEPRLRGKGTRAAPSDVNGIQDEGCGTAWV